VKVGGGKDYLTVGELRAAIAALNDEAWVCDDAGIISHVFAEPGANEPFVLLVHAKPNPDVAEAD
jgi:hypothetical protein